MDNPTTYTPGDARNPGDLLEFARQVSDLAKPIDATFNPKATDAQKDISGTGLQMAQQDVTDVYNRPQSSYLPGLGDADREIQKTQIRQKLNLLADQLSFASDLSNRQQQLDEFTKLKGLELSTLQADMDTKQAALRGSLSNVNLTQSIRQQDVSNATDFVRADINYKLGMASQDLKNDVLTRKLSLDQALQSLARQDLDEQRRGQEIEQTLQKAKLEKTPSAFFQALGGIGLLESSLAQLGLQSYTATKKR